MRAETTKNRLERVVPYSAPTGVLLADYLTRRAAISLARGPLFLSESRRNHGQPLSLWTWSKVVRRLALTAGVDRFSTHTTRHLFLTDLARMGWEVHAIASFAGHRHTDTTLQYIHLSGRDLAEKLKSGMDHIHAWRVRMLAAAGQSLAMTTTVPTVGTDGGWQCPIDLRHYDRSPVLSKTEQRAIRELGVRNLCRLRHHDRDAPQWAEIGRLLRPLQDVNASFDTPPSMHARRAMHDAAALLSGTSAAGRRGR
ncbi:tyrosine-type recombinase/integrase [Streptomyces mirabilis]|uniref:tyrosine-type recombinase/integrase n=1 Tax=Streptomyces mirabilis TaxID=68239 RepID=UPI0036A7FB4B